MQVELPDEVVPHAPDCCKACSRPLGPGLGGEGHEARQVFDLPKVQLGVVEHRALRVRCGCGELNEGSFPPGVDAPAQYGAGVRALAAYLMTYQHIPFARAAELLGDLIGAEVSTGTLDENLTALAANLEGFSDEVRRQLRGASVLHLDETGARVAGALGWVHVAATAALTLYGVHERRGTEGTDSLGLLPPAMVKGDAEEPDAPKPQGGEQRPEPEQPAPVGSVQPEPVEGSAAREAKAPADAQPTRAPRPEPAFCGVIVHDGWTPYRKYPVDHGLCGGHHLRELTAAAEAPGQSWAHAMSELLCELGGEVERAKETGAPALSPATLRRYERRYQKLIQTGHRENPEPQRAPGKRGRPKRSKPHNLLRRLDTQRQDVLRFAHDFRVPFTNYSEVPVMPMWAAKPVLGHGVLAGSSA